MLESKFSIMSWVSQLTFGICVSCIMQNVSRADLPALMARQSAEIQQTWYEINQIILENEALPNPLAEPYLARGDLWSRVGGQEDALTDYLKATELFFQKQPTLIEQTRHLARLRSSLEAVVQQPRPRFPSEAAEQYGKGITAFRRGDFASAELEFAEATRLMPEVAIYRVHRALSLHQAKKEPEAKRQAEIALSLIRSNGIDARREMSQINLSLEHIQGPLRLWLSKELEVVSKTERAADCRAAPSFANK